MKIRELGPLGAEVTNIDLKKTNKNDLDIDISDILPMSENSDILFF